MEEEHEWSRRRDAGPAERLRGIIRTCHGNRVATLRAQRQRGAQQIGEVADGGVRAPDGVEVVADPVQTWKSIMQAGSGNSDRMAAVSEASDGLVRVAVATQVGRKEQVATEEHGAAAALHAQLLLMNVGA